MDVESLQCQRDANLRQFRLETKTNGWYNCQTIRGNNMMLKEIEFKKINIEDRAYFLAKEKEDYLTVCDQTFASNFIWKDEYNVKIANVGNCAVVGYSDEEGEYYGFPVGGSDEDKIAAVKMLEEFVGDNIRWTVLSKSQYELLEKASPKEYEITRVRAWADYVYTREKLAYLKGRHLAAKRNYINGIDDGTISYEKIDNSNIHLCREIEKKWLKENKLKDSEGELTEEQRAILNAIDHFKELELMGGILRQNGEPIAFAIASQLNENTVDVIFEKADSESRGAYAMINKEFAMNLDEKYTYIDREEDLGLPGLRKAKKSYHPDFMVEKYYAEKTGFTFAAKDDYPEITEIWKEAFGDEEEYIENFLENKDDGNTILCLRKENKIAAALALLKTSIYIKGKKREALYVYACMTRKEERHKGYMLKLLEHVQVKTEIPLILRSAEEGLKELYKKAGFKDNFRVEEHEFYSYKLGISHDIHYGNDINEKFYKKLRDKSFAGEGYVEWDEAAIRYAMDELIDAGGEVLGNDKAAILCEKHDDYLMIGEAVGEHEDILELVNAILRDNGLNRANFKNSGAMLWVPQKYRGYCIDDGYFNLALD